MPAGEPMSPARIITDEELLQLPKDGNKYEVVDGELVVSPGAGFRHELIVAKLVTRLRSFADERGLGAVQAGRPSPLPRGTIVPDLELRDLEGESVRLAQVLSGRSAVLFWNPGCGFCQQMLGDLRSWEERTEDPPAQLLVISQGTREENAAMGLRSTVLLDSGFAAGHAFGTSGTPTALLVDEAGRISSELAIGRQAVLELLASGT